MLRISEFLISFFYLQNFYSELSATWTDCDVQLKIFIQYTDVRCPRCFSISSCGCVCVRVARLCRCMGVRARQSIWQILLGPRRVASPRLVSSLSLFLSLSVRFACSTDFILELHLMALNLQMPKGRKKRGRESRAEHNNANNNSLAPSLFLPLSLSLSHSPCAFTCPCACPCVFRLYDFWIFPNIFELYSAQYFYFYASLFICFSLVDFFLLILFTAIFNFQLLICQKTEIFASQNSHTYMIHIYIYILGYFL